MSHNFVIWVLNVCACVVAAVVHTYNLTILYQHQKMEKEFSGLVEPLWYVYRPNSNRPIIVSMFELSVDLGLLEHLVFRK